MTVRYKNGVILCLKSYYSSYNRWFVMGTFRVSSYADIEFKRQVFDKILK